MFVSVSVYTTGLSLWYQTETSVSRELANSVVWSGERRRDTDVEGHTPLLFQTS